jgi:hypothetical protein
MTLYMAPKIKPDSWLNEERFAAFVEAYYYASGQTQAIIGLSKLEPEDMYYVWASMDYATERKNEAVIKRYRAALERIAAFSPYANDVMEAIVIAQGTLDAGEGDK